jgi:hypothetical protein
LIRDNKTSDFSEDSQGTLWLGRWICVPNLKPIKELILREAHDSTYSIHPGSTKMYNDLNIRYWWYTMKRDVSHPDSRKQNRSLHTCAQDVQITRTANNISLNYKLESLQNDPWVQKKYYIVAQKSKRRCVFHRHNRR